jgi:hypothetical protein
MDGLPVSSDGRNGLVGSACYKVVEITGDMNVTETRIFLHDYG